MKYLFLLLFIGMSANATINCTSDGSIDNIKIVNVNEHNQIVVNYKSTGVQYINSKTPVLILEDVKEYTTFKIYLFTKDNNIYIYETVQTRIADESVHMTNLEQIVKQKKLECKYD